MALLFGCSINSQWEIQLLQRKQFPTMPVVYLSSRFWILLTLCHCLSADSQTVIQLKCSFVCSMCGCVFSFLCSLLVHQRLLCQWLHNMVMGETEVIWSAVISLITVPSVQMSCWSVRRQMDSLQASSVVHYSLTLTLTLLHNVYYSKQKEFWLLCW